MFARVCAGLVRGVAQNQPVRYMSTQSTQSAVAEYLKDHALFNEIVAKDADLSKLKGVNVETLSQAEFDGLADLIYRFNQIDLAMDAEADGEVAAATTGTVAATTDAGSAVVDQSSLPANDWSSIVHNFTSKDDLRFYSQLDAKLASAQNFVKSVNPTIAPVDWSVWEKQLDFNPEFLQEMKEEYEESLAEEASATVEIEDAVVFDKYVQDFSALHAANYELKTDRYEYLKVQEVQCKEEETLIFHWSPEEVSDWIPGLEQQLRDEYVVGDYFAPDELQNWYDSLDFAAAHKAFDAGKPLPLDVPANIQCGDMNTSVEDEGSRKFRELGESFRALRADYLSNQKALPLRRAA